MKPNRMIFTEESVLVLPMRRKQYRVWDGGRGRGSDPVARGLCVLVSPAGAKSYRSTYYFPGSPKAHSRHLGRVGETALDKARQQCRADRTMASQGIDPRVGQGSDAFEATVRDYIQREQIGARKNVKASEVERLLLRECAEWARRPVGSIRPPEIQALLERTRDRAPYVANALYARLVTFFKWCAKPAIGKLAISPMVGIDKPFHGQERRQRDWFKGSQADQAIRSIWAAAAKLDPVAQRYLKLALITGKRRTALACMRWEEIDDQWFWNAPGGTRNKRLHGAPLPVLAQHVLGKRKDKGYVFPGEDAGRIKVKRTKFEITLKQVVGIDGFFLHGVRHLAETKLAELKVDPHIRDLLFDHVPNRGSGKGYDHHQYRDEMLAALELWAAHIERLVQPQGAALLR
jgi:integrase